MELFRSLVGCLVGYGQKRSLHACAARGSQQVDFGNLPDELTVDFKRASWTSLAQIFPFLNWEVNVNGPVLSRYARVAHHAVEEPSLPFCLFL